ncbi:13191_t:CDS:2 [Funneliformis geosporum]|uniref:ubiquitinyl hydrolase 1 n=1 Tax=Funneliformis geosporum TaxID=1117311 RepID=A0A9W4SXC1_9GLOM|nr:13191_t:CDS:2 [Funneliformis geosporum]CAI2184805.1 6560_t:CDS:2 [Funneliformis geosporum]
MGGGDDNSREEIHDGSMTNQEENTNAQQNLEPSPNLPEKTAIAEEDSSKEAKQIPEEKPNENAEGNNVEQEQSVIADNAQAVGASATETISVGNSSTGPVEAHKPEDTANRDAAHEDQVKFQQNLEYEISIKKEEAERTPLVCLSEDIQKLYQEYEQGSDVYRNKIMKLAERHNKIRRCRGDGNCFYRAFGFAWFERLLLSNNSTILRAALDSLVATKTLLNSSGYQPLVYDDIYDVVEEQMKAIERGERDDSMLLAIFQTDEISNHIVWYLRVITAAYLKKYRQEYEPFLEFETEMDQYCSKYVEVMDQEADHIHVIALTKALNVPVEIAYMSGSDAMEQVNFHEFYPDNEATGGNLTLKPLVLLYRPGHYDILYRKE